MRILEEYRDSDGQLPRWAWPGGYPLFYMGLTGSVICSSCARAWENTPADKRFEDDAPTTYDVNWEDPDLYCDACSGRIESAYAEETGD